MYISSLIQDGVCPVCGNIIKVFNSQHIIQSYCRNCGERIDNSNTNGKLSQELLSNDTLLQSMDAWALFYAAKSQEPFDKKLMNLSAQKNYPEANLYLGYDYYKSNDLLKKKKALPYLEIAHKANIPDAIILKTIIKYIFDDYTNLEELLEILERVPQNNKQYLLNTTYTERQNFIEKIKDDIRIRNTPKIVVKSTSNPISDQNDNVSCPDLCSYGIKYQPIGAGTFLDSRAQIREIMNDPGASDYDKQQALAEHNRWYLDNYDGT